MSAKENSIITATTAATKPWKTSGTKDTWVTVYTCSHCRAKGHAMPKCSQCEVAHYCDRNCQRAHWKIHKHACIAVVATRARNATRERLARANAIAAREEETDESDKKGGAGVSHPGDGAMCVVCFSQPMVDRLQPRRDHHRRRQRR